VFACAIVGELLTFLVGSCSDKLSACPDSVFGILRKYTEFGIAPLAAHSIWALGKGDATTLIGHLSRDFALAPYLEVTSQFVRLLAVS
jgi:hypothetical protein